MKFIVAEPLLESLSLGGGIILKFLLQALLAEEIVLCDDSQILVATIDIGEAVADRFKFAPEPIETRLRAQLFNRRRKLIDDFDSVRAKRVDKIDRETALRLARTSRRVLPKHFLFVASLKVQIELQLQTICFHSN